MSLIKITLKLIQTFKLANKDPQNRNLAFEKIVKEIMAMQRKKDTEMYRKFVTEEGYALAFIETMKWLTGIDGFKL